MATNGLVTIRANNEVVMKVVVGINGMFAPNFAQKLKEFGRIPSMAEARKIAFESSFGFAGEVDIISKDGHLMRDGKEPSPLYRETFNNPKFNPRWECGLIEDECFAIVDF